MSARLLTTAVALCLSAAAGAQQIRTFTETASEPNALVYGLPVPLPINSLTPVDGFRSYASLEARLQALALESPDLAAHDIGRSTANRVQWAYVASDEDGIDVEGRPEAAFFINATTHAREWAAPEVATGTLERLLAGASDEGIVRYVLEKTQPTDTLFVWGFRAETYVSARRLPASRYVYTVYPAGVVPWFQATREEEERRAVPGARDLLLADLERYRPELVIDAGRSMNGRYMYNYPPLRNYLDRNYCFMRYVDGEPVYRRRQGEQCPPADY